MPTLILMCGPPGSGKSHCRKRDLEDAHVISPDDIIVEWGDGEYLWTPGKAAAAWREADTRLEWEMLLAADGEGTHETIVFDAVFDRPKRRKKYVKLARQYGWDVETYYVKTPLDVCLERNAARPETRRVPEETLERMASRMQAPTRAEGFDRVVTVSGTR